MDVDLPSNPFHLNKTEKVALHWLIHENEYDISDIQRDSPHQSPDFICPDEQYEVKRLQGQKVLVSPRQDEIFADVDPVILVMLESQSEPIEKFRWSERDEADTATHIYEETERIEIHCSAETKQEFKKAKADIGPNVSHEEALLHFIQLYQEDQKLRDTI